MEEYGYPGFRFYPIEEELISFYLINKLEGRRPDIDRVIPVVDIYDHLPSDLPQLAGEYSRGDSEEQWFFFVPMQDREARGGRPNRLTNEGYWKATGSPGYVYSSINNRIIGGKRTMVFYKGRAPNGQKTPWKMNEYRAINNIIDDQPQLISSSNHPKFRQELSLCRVYNGSKSVRAFDRRPAPAAARAGVHHHHQVEGTSSGHHHQHDDHHQPITSHQYPNRSSLAEGAGSRSSLSSSSEEEEEDGPINPPPPPPPPPQPTEIDKGYVDMNFQNVPIWEWDWEQYNLF